MVDLLSGNRDFVAAATSTRSTRSPSACSPAIPTSGSPPAPGSSPRGSRGRCSYDGSCSGAAARRYACVLRRQRGAARGHGRSLRRLRGRPVALAPARCLARRAARRDRGGAKPRGIYEQRRLRPLGGQAPPEPAHARRGDEAPLELVVDGGRAAGSASMSPRRSAWGCSPICASGWAAVAARAADRRVLNLFSYTGAFSVHAAKAGAAEVVAVDTAAKAHARARRNYELSGLNPARMEAITADALKTLERFASRGRRFDLVVCDPPRSRTGPAGSSPSRAIWRPWPAACAAVLSRAACSRSPRTRRRCRRPRSTVRSARGRRCRRRPANHRARRLAAGLPGGARFSRGKLPEVRPPCAP